jgi:hypothetical protein
MNEFIKLANRYELILRKAQATSGQPAEIQLIFAGYKIGPEKISGYQNLTGYNPFSREVDLSCPMADTAFKALEAADKDIANVSIIVEPNGNVGFASDVQPVSLVLNTAWASKLKERLLSAVKAGYVALPINQISIGWTSLKLS